MDLTESYVNYKEIRSEPLNLFRVIFNSYNTKISEGFYMALNGFTGETNNIIGQSPIWLEIMDLAHKVAKSHSNVLLSGESGTGKEVLAKYIHSKSRVNQGPLVIVNCSAIPETLLESELFGHTKGSFTGAQFTKIGLFEEAQNGTIFLD